MENLDQIKGESSAGTNIEVQSPVTQQEKQLKKISSRHRVLQVKLTIVQGEYSEHLIWMIEK